jgi:hypothetical protein
VVKKKKKWGMVWQEKINYGVWLWGLVGVGRAGYGRYGTWGILLDLPLLKGASLFMPTVTQDCVTRQCVCCAGACALMLWLVMCCDVEGF